MQIDWSNLEKNMDSEELTFESFNFQIAWAKFSSFGDFEYDYNTPGVEFYLTLNKDCPELNLKSADIVGWQAKFWVNHNDMNNTQMDSRRRAELKGCLQKTLLRKPNLKAWVICTPGQIKADARQSLEYELTTIKSDLMMIFWNKPIYEAFYYESHEILNPIFSHYFSSQFIGFQFLKEYTQMRINRLGEKFDTDLYVHTSINDEIELVLDYRKIKLRLHLVIHEWQDYMEYGIKRCEQYISKINNTDKHQVCLSNLLKFLLEFWEEFHTKFSEFKETSDVSNVLINLFGYIRDSINAWNELVKEMQSCDKSDSEKKSSAEHNLYREINSQFVFFDKILNLHKKFYQTELHVFGKAGYGKTNFSCAVCQKALEKGIPSILILASEIRAESNISKWIVDSLQVQLNLTTLLGFLNNLGFLKQTKIPIVIDGLNEKYPDAAIWQSELDYLRQQVAKFTNIVLITTSRESYVKQIFNKTNYKEVQNNFYLEGFNHYTLHVALKKYFKKYRIRINNNDYDKSIFQNPLLLRIFCTVHEGKTFTFYPSNIYETMENYHQFLISKIAANFPGQESRVCKIIKDRIDDFCLKLLHNASKNIDYESDFFNIFDPGFEPSSQPKIVISDKILDEGMFIKREILNNHEVVEFTHDFIGGFLIAKAIAFSNNDSQEIIQKIKNQDLMSNVIDLNTGEFLHPLSEDILKNLIYFFKKKTLGQLYDVLKFDSIIKLELSMLEVVDLSNKERQELIKTLLSSDKKDLILSFFEVVILNITDKKDYCGIEILLGLISKLSAKDIDLYWSETIRINSAKILNYLDKLSSLVLKPNNKIQEISCFISCLFSSTHRLIRDKATKVLVNLGEYAPDDVFTTFRKMEQVSDLYINERIIAALRGAILRKGSNFKEKCIEIAQYLENKYFKEYKTSHLLILDYIDTILHFVSHFYGYKQHYFIDPKQLRNWQKDKECLKDLKDDDRATWGYGPIFMDFANYTIGHHITSYGYIDKAPPLKEVIAMLIWRIKDLGYDEKLFGEIDKKCSESRHNFSQHDNSGAIERYGKKYSWIAFFELYGQLVLKDIVKTEAPNSYRVSSIDIDPTFPALPSKEQLMTKCFLPHTGEDIQMWVNRQEKMLLNEIYSFRAQEENWILLNCCNHQQNTYNICIDIKVDAILLPKERGKEALEIFNESEDSPFEYKSDEYYYLFNGEIPWGKLIHDNNISELFDHTERLLVSPYAWFSWESYHSRMNDIGNVPFLNKTICDEFNLKYDIESFAFFDKDEVCTKYYHDNFSHYYFIKEKYIKDFLKKNNLSLVWCEFVHKYGDLDLENKRQLDPATSRIRAAIMMDMKRNNIL